MKIGSIDFPWRSFTEIGEAAFYHE